jgi:predicted ribosome quality control (RQC) complex YloA/Tae2 family protein
MKSETIFIKAINRYINFYIGKSKNENFEVIDKGNAHDLWFHAKNISSCHVISIIPDDITDKKNLKYIIKIGALLCKNNTNKLKGLQNIEITYTKIKNIIKTNILGQVEVLESKTITC